MPQVPDEGMSMVVQLGQEFRLVACSSAPSCSHIVMDHPIVILSHRKLFLEAFH
jgi:ssDNA-binding Zn-finger/Zn-ribbon topoisomerase 1